MAASFAESFNRLTRSPGFKFFLVVLLIFILTIPLALVWFVVNERENRSAAVKQELAQLFGGEQQLIGPLLIVPYTVQIKRIQDNKEIEETHERYATFLPDDFLAEGEAKSEIRRRSIYEVTLYSARLKLSGQFSAPDIRLIEPDAANVRWRDAILSIGLSDVSGLKEAASLRIDGGRTIAFEPSIGLPDGHAPGLHVRLFPVGGSIDQAPGTFRFETELVFNGSSRLTIAPIGRNSQLVLKSDWPHPSFNGAFLPESREISSDGFTASWRVPHLARSIPQAWRTDAQQAGSIHATLFPVLSGVSFFVPVDYYALVNRAAKYALMFLSVAFLAVLVLELTSGRRIHAVQYVFVGLTMILFYVLLLSLSEHIGFTLAYLIASGATGGMLSLYTGKAMQSAARGLIMLFVFLILYGLLYLILRLEDFALLAGAVAGFIMLTVTMFATLRINWSGEAASPAGQQS
ncbi:MAG TPA: cell envelope integrity protein CreD [Hyphomicrobiales bacterium]|nr:cell envelope integrity protein CreD [Hyphomicrobiales bacterium]